MAVVIEEVQVDVAPPPREAEAREADAAPRSSEQHAGAALEALALELWRQGRLAAD